MKPIQMCFPEGKRKAFTTSYDDGVRQDERLLGIMRKYNIKGTFNLNSGILGRVGTASIDGFETDIATFHKDEISEMYEGQEIACHGQNHLDLIRVPSCVAAQETLSDKIFWEKMLQKPVIGFAYPFGTYNCGVLNTLECCGISYARTVKSTHTFSIPENFLEWNPTCHHNDEMLMELLKRFCCEEGWDMPWLFYLWGHSYEFDQRQNWQRIEEALAYAAEASDSVWMASNGEIYRYVQAFRRLEFTAEGDRVYNPSALDLWLRAGTEIYRIPSGKTVQIME